MLDEHKCMKISESILEMQHQKQTMTFLQIMITIILFLFNRCFQFGIYISIIWLSQLRFLSYVNHNLLLEMENIRIVDRN